MSIQDTIEAIKAMPENAEFFVGRIFPSIGQTIQGYGNTNTIADLKELAEACKVLDRQIREIRTVLVSYHDPYVAVRVIEDILGPIYPPAIPELEPVERGKDSQ